MDCDHTSMAPEMEVEVARQALRQGDLAHCAHHVAGVLAADPTREDHEAVWQELCRAAGDGLVDLFAPTEEGMWFGAAACRARALHLAGEDAAALDLICQVTLSAPSVPYLGWALSWPLPDEDATLVALNRLMKTYEPKSWELALATVGDRAAAAFPSNAQLFTVLSIGARRAGHLERSLELVQQGLAADRTWFGAITLANAHRALGNIEEMEAAWQDATGLDPNDASAFLDWGDNLMERREHDRAREKYASALTRVEGQPWATASLWYLDYLGSGTAAARQILAELARSQPGNPRAQWAIRRATPWMGFLPSPSDATANALAQLEGNDSPAISMAVTHLEGASVLRGAALTCPGLDLSIGEIPDPDPRTPLGEPRWTLYTWDGHHPSPALGPPPPAIHTALEPLVFSHYDSEQWLGTATQIALTLGVEAVPDLLAATLHPLRSDGVPAYRMLWRTQHAVAFVLAAFPGWSGDAVDALHSMLAIRNDWMATAALAGAAARAESDVQVRPAAVAMAMEVLQARPDSGGFETATPAWHTLLRLDPGDEHGLAATAVSWLDG